MKVGQAAKLAAETSGNSASDSLLNEYSVTPSTSNMKTPRTPMPASVSEINAYGMRKYLKPMFLNILPAPSPVK